jgi:hypothetical protein
MIQRIYDKYVNKIILKNNSKILTEEILLDFEKKNNIQLSREFKDFYLCFNGAKLNFQEYPATFFNSRNPQGIFGTIEAGYFFRLEEITVGVYPGDPNEIGFDPDSYEGFGWSPLKAQKYLWFGCAFTGTGYLLGIQPENFGKIFCWFSEEEELYNPIWFADSFFEFMDNFQDGK